MGVKRAPFNAKTIQTTLDRFHAPTGIRTPVLALKGLRPGPLDDGGAQLSECNSTIHSQAGQEFIMGRIRA